MIEDRSTLILYSTAVCNLKCTYCFIDKNPALVNIDNLLDESFKGDYYFNFCKEIFPNKEQLREIQIWGGEPTLNFHRIVPTIKKILNYYPNVNRIMFSTNLTPEECLDEIYYLLSNIDKDREITLDLQLSIDGPTYINDINRGQGTTEKFSKNFVKLVTTVHQVLKDTKIYINAFNKSTLDISSISYLQDKQKIIDYYKFLELYYNISLNCKTEQFTFNPTVPNTACPLPITKEDGLKFANLCKLCREIEKENKEKNYFSYFKYVTPYGTNLRQCDSTFCNKGSCGSGKFSVGLLPEKMISTCHNGFTELISDYKKYANENNITHLQKNFFSSQDIKNPMVFPVEELSVYEKQIEEFYNCNSSNVVKSILGEIQFLALNNQIDNKYSNIKNAIDATLFICNRTSMCIRDNLNVTGTKNLVPFNLLKLLLNGAKDYIEQEE